MSYNQHTGTELLRDRLDIDPDTLAQLLEYYGDDATVNEVAMGKHGGIIQYANQCLASKVIADMTIDRAQRR